MSLLQKLGLKPYSRVSNPDDIGYAARLSQRIASAQFADAEILLKNSSDQARERLIYGFSISPNALESAARWASQSQNSAFAHICLGACMISTGWAIRGNSYAEDVEESAWQPFLNQLQGAEDPLHRACALDNSLSEPYAWLIHAGIGRGADKTELRKYFQEGVERNALHHSTYMKYSYATAEKWGGSHKEMLAFVRETSQKLPLGHVLHYLVADAYCELTLSIRSENGQSALKKKLAKASYAAEVEEALFKYADANANNLADRLDRLSGPFIDRHLNVFALALYITGASKSAKIVCSHLNNEIHTLPWIWATQGIRQRFFPAFYFDKASRESGINQSI